MPRELLTVVVHCPERPWVVGVDPLPLGAGQQLAHPAGQRALVLQGPSHRLLHQATHLPAKHDQFAATEVRVGLKS